MPKYFWANAWESSPRLRSGEATASEAADSMPTREEVEERIVDNNRSVNGMLQLSSKFDSILTSIFGEVEDNVNIDL